MKKSIKIADEKDIDGFKVTSKYTPCTPKGIMTILDSLDMDLAGKSAVIIGKGKTVGKPLINLLLDRGVTVTVCHSRTSRFDLQKAVYYSDIVISAVGKTMITKDMITNCVGQVPPGILRKVIIDVGIHRDENGKQIGDVDKDVYEVVDYVTPWKFGCGIMTRAMIFENLLKE